MHSRFNAYYTTCAFLRIVRVTHRNTVLEMVLVEEDITLSEMHALSRVCACSRLSDTM